MEERPLKKQKLTTWGKAVRLHRTIQKLFPQPEMFGSIDETREDIDGFLDWATCYLDKLVKKGPTVCIVEISHIIISFYRLRK